MHMHRSFLLIFKLIKVLVNKYIPSLSNTINVHHQIQKELLHEGGYRTKRVGFIGDGASKLLAPSLF